MTDNQSSTGSAEAMFDVREFEENAFRSMEVQICGETRTVQFTTSDHGGDHPTSPSVAIDWAAAVALATWIMSRAGDAAQAASILDREVKFRECAGPEPKLRSLIFSYYMQGISDAQK